MKTKSYLLIILIMISFWLAQQHVSGNTVIQKNDTMVFLHYTNFNVINDYTSAGQKETTKFNTFYAKIDTTQNDYIFISAQPLAAEMNSLISNPGSKMSSWIVNKRFDQLAGVYYFDPKAIQFSILITKLN